MRSVQGKKKSLIAVIVQSNGFTMHAIVEKNKNHAGFTVPPPSEKRGRKGYKDRIGLQEGKSIVHEREKKRTCLEQLTFTTALSR